MSSFRSWNMARVTNCAVMLEWSGQELEAGVSVTKG